MANSDKKEEKAKYIAHKNESKLVKAAKRQKIIYCAFAAVIALILVFVGLGVGTWYKDEYKPIHSTVITVGDREFDGQYFIDVLAFVSSSYPDYASLFTSYAVEYIESSEIVYQEATKLGYTVDDSTISQYMSYYGYDEEVAIYDILRASYLEEQMLEDKFIPMLPSTADHRSGNIFYCDDETSALAAVTAINGGTSWEEAAETYASENSTAAVTFELMPIEIFESTYSAEGLGDAVFAAELNSATTGNFGDSYYVYVVTESVEQAYSEDDQDTLANDLLTDWISEQKEAYADKIVESYDTDFLLLAAEKVKNG